MSGSSDGKAIAGGAILGVALVEIWQKLTGDSYNEEDRNRLTTLKTLYQNALQLPAPITWELDEKYCPTHSLSPNCWSSYAEQLQGSKGNHGHLHLQCRKIAEYITTYLENRGNRTRGTGRGNKGDFLEQFLSDWLSFALNELPTFDCDDKTIEKINQRIEYLKQVKNHPKLFSFGTITRDKNKHDLFNMIDTQLKKCLARANEEATRKCAREQFDKCRRGSESLLSASIEILYYMRSTPVHHEPLELDLFVDEKQTLTKAAANIYPGIKNSHTGSMLQEVISLAGLDSFGAIGNPIRSATQSVYFTSRYKPRPIQYDTKRFDLPPWIAVSDKEKQIIEFQRYSESLLRISRLKKLIEDAYDLSGKAGDLWAYGDVEGRKSLDALLFLLDEELKEFKSRFSSLYKFHNDNRERYNLKHKINPDDPINKNFSKVEKQKKIVEKVCVTLEDVTKKIREQMMKFPKESVKEVNEKKKAFYRGISTFFQDFRPEQVDKFHLSVHDEKSPSPVIEMQSDSMYSMPTHEEKHISSAIGTIASPQYLPSPAFILTFPVREDIEYKGYFYMDKKEFLAFKYQHPNKDKIERKWDLGGKYYDWMKGFFTRNQANTVEYQMLANTFLSAVEKSSATEDIKKASVAFLEYIKMQKEKIENERPKWRFKWGLWPIKTKGWPFNQDANQFAENMLNELVLVEKQIPTAVLFAESRIKDQTHSDTISEADQKSKAVSNVSEPISTLLARLDKQAIDSVPDAKKVEVRSQISGTLLPTSANENKHPATNNDSKHHLHLGATTKSGSLAEQASQPNENTTASSLPAAIAPSFFSQVGLSMNSLLLLLAETRKWSVALVSCSHGMRLEIFYSRDASPNLSELLILREKLTAKDLEKFSARCAALTDEIKTILQKTPAMHAISKQQAELFVKLLQILIDPSCQRKRSEYEIELMKLSSQKFETITTSSDNRDQTFTLTRPLIT